ncbi:MAG: hypothetical protein RBT63_01740 [Bdellovibrionales bacterium]|nr:hypothetical protein [Bdellovibrionales bacterium]
MSRVIALSRMPVVASLLALPLILMSVSQANAAREVRFKEFPLEISAEDRLVVQGIRGSVKIVPVAAGKTPVIKARKVLPDNPKGGASERFDALSFTVRRDHGVVTVEPRGPSARQDWIEWSRPGQPELHVEIESPAVATEVFYHSGSVTVSGWKDDLAISLQEGRVQTSAGEGKLGISVLRGDIRVEKQDGAVTVENHAGKIAVTNVVGDVRVHAFSSETALNSIKGSVLFRSKQGYASGGKIEGGFEFDTGRGNVNINGVEGAIRGVNVEAAITLQLSGESDVSIETDEGPVSIRPAAGIGSLLKLSIEEGGIIAPNSVQVPRVSGPKSVVARMNGTPKGSITVRSKRGTIRIR